MSDAYETTAAVGEQDMKAAANQYKESLVSVNSAEQDYLTTPQEAGFRTTNNLKASAVSTRTF